MYKPTPTQDVKIWFAAWVMAEFIEVDRKEQERVKYQEKLNQAGFWAYENGEGYPVLGHWLYGAVQKGDKLIWGPGTVHEEYVTVKSVTPGGEWAVLVGSVLGGDRREYPNEISYIRSMCIRAR